MENNIKSPERRHLLKGIVTGSAAFAVNPVVALEPKQSDRLSWAKGELEQKIQGNLYWRGDTRYEITRASNCYRMNKPNRFPALIVQPVNDKDVVEAVRFAKEHKLKVTTRSGGHSWSASHIRDDCLLIDMSRMQTLSIDAESKTLWTNPGVLGSRINAELKPHGLLIPTAHHPSPGIGGFAMNGGFGWNSRLTGNGAAHIMAIDVVTADGELIRADENQNTDYLWAARGSGAGFFGVVTNMKFRCDPLWKVMKVSAYGFREEQFEELFTWARNTYIPPFIEMIIVSSRVNRTTGEEAPVGITLAALALTNDEKEADEGLDILKTCPVIDKAYFAVDKKVTDIETQYASGYSADPAGFRFAADNMYTNAPAEVLVPRIKKVFTQTPTPRTHTFWMNWQPSAPYPDDMALSVQDNFFIATYTLWTDPAQDEEMMKWPVEQMKELEDLSTGGQMNDENFLYHPQNYLSRSAYRKLERLRKKYDPDLVFETFMGSPRKP